MHGHGEFATGHGIDFFGKDIGRAENGVKCLGKAGGQTPANGSLGMHSRCDPRGEHASDARVLDDGTTIHIHNS